MIDWMIFLIALLVTLAAVLTAMWRDAERECAHWRNEAARQRLAAEEERCWTMLQAEKVCAVRARLADVQRRHADAQRALLAANYYVIEQHVRRRKSAA